LSALDQMWPVLGRLVRVHVAVYRATGGVVGHRMPFTPPMLLVDHVGARTGAHRTTALAYVEDGPNLVLVASKGGHPHHPGWYHNLLANPDTTVQIGSRRTHVHARVATPEERSRLWPKVVAAYRGYLGYQDRTKRQIPLVILEPRA
jgi:deazaflavin-dependent oxidoreductase (nitroreductase family)